MSKEVIIRKLELENITPKKNEDFVWLRLGNKSSLVTDQKFLKASCVKNKKNKK